MPVNKNIERLGKVAKFLDVKKPASGKSGKEVLTPGDVLLIEDSGMGGKREAYIVGGLYAIEGYYVSLVSLTNGTPDSFSYCKKTHGVGSDVELRDLIPDFKHYEITILQEV